MEPTWNESAVVTVPTLVRRALQRSDRERAQAEAMPHRTHAENARRAERLAVISNRQSRWYGVLHRWVYSEQGTVPLVFGRTAMVAESRDMLDARFWAENAAYYRARLAGHDHEQAESVAWSS